MADFTWGKLFFGVHILLGKLHPAELSSLGATSASSFSLLHRGPQTGQNIPAVSPWVLSRGNSWDVLECSVCYSPGTWALQDLLENTWNGRKTLSPELCSPQVVVKHRITPSQGVGICLCCPGRASGWPGLTWVAWSAPKGSPALLPLPRGNLLRDIVTPATAGHLHSVYFTSHTWNVWVTLQIILDYLYLDHLCLNR